jgi:hypothetical protein
MSEDEAPAYDDDGPPVDPTIRTDYEAALGRCLLAFNQLDNLLGTILLIVLTRLDRPDLVDDCIKEADFNKMLLIFDLLKHCKEGVGINGVPLGPLRDVAKQRNLLAHAHFDDNHGMSDEYRLEDRRKKLKQTYSTKRIDSLVQQIRAAEKPLRDAECYYQFCDIPIPPEPA